MNSKSAYPPGLGDAYVPMTRQGWESSMFVGLPRRRAYDRLMWNEKMVNPGDWAGCLFYVVIAIHHGGARSSSVVSLRELSGAR